MKKLFLIVLFVLFVINCCLTQELPAIQGASALFANIPILKTSKERIEFIAKQTSLGIDSITERGVYSSIKEGYRGHFPFPDSVLVKILSSTQQSTYLASKPPLTIETIAIEGVWGDDKKDKKDVERFFKQLQRYLKQYYKTREIQDISFGDYILFSKGIDSDFPKIQVRYGYEPQLKFYNVLIAYERVIKN
jgi:hypothetical protein